MKMEKLPISFISVVIAKDDELPCQIIAYVEGTPRLYGAGPTVDAALSRIVGFSGCSVEELSRLIC